MTEMRVSMRLTEWKSIDRTKLQNKQNWLTELMNSTILGKQANEEVKRKSNYNRENKLKIVQNYRK